VSAKKTRDNSQKTLEPGTWNLELKKPAVFLDRDGTIIDELGYLGDPDKVVLYPGVHDALINLNKAGYLLIVVTNQSGVARGYFTLEDALAVNYKMVRMLADLGANIHGIYFCPHLPDGGCFCRKPAPGMVQKAEADFNVDLPNSWIIGDTDKDVLLGPEAGVSSLLVKTGKQDKGVVPSGVPVVTDLNEAARHIMET
jgi:histidinol-phosphate phosphatase family protein